MIDLMRCGRGLAAAGAAMFLASCATMGDDGLRLADRAAIGELLNRADRGLDVADVAMFTASFTDDAELQFNDNRYSGLAEIQALVEGRAANRRARDAGQGDPNTQLYRVMTNSIIEFTGPDTAHHSAYVVVVGHTTPETHMSASGTYDDQLVKRDGQWRIRSRVMDTLPRYVPPAAAPGAATAD
jgi:hypothetical protein